jgi:hypothetical protein
MTWEGKNEGARVRGCGGAAVRRCGGGARARERARGRREHASGRMAVGVGRRGQARR